MLPLAWHHVSVWGSGDVVQCVLNLDTKWSDEPKTHSTLIERKDEQGTAWALETLCTLCRISLPLPCVEFRIIHFIAGSPFGHGYLELRGPSFE